MQPFKTRGLFKPVEQPDPVLLPTNTFVGLDLGQSRDPSALVVLRNIPPAASAPAGTKPTFAVPLVRRWPLGTSYVAIVADVVKMFNAPALAGQTLVIDTTGCGRPVFDMIRDAHPNANIVGVLFTGGAVETFHPSGLWHVAKTILVAATKVPLQQRRIKFAEQMPLVEILTRELENYRLKLTLQANEVYGAKDSEHDDLVMALALACWAADHADRWTPRIVVLDDARFAEAEADAAEEADAVARAMPDGLNLNIRERELLGLPTSPEDAARQAAVDLWFKRIAAGEQPTAAEIWADIAHNHGLDPRQILSWSPDIAWPPPSWDGEQQP